SGRFASRVASAKSTQPNPPSTSQGARAHRSSVPGRRPRANRSPAAPYSNRDSPSSPIVTATRASRCRGRRIGAAIGLRRNRSSSAGAGFGGFTTASATADHRRTRQDGMSSGWRREPEGPLPGSPPERGAQSNESGPDRRGVEVTGGDRGTTRTLAALILLG